MHNHVYKDVHNDVQKHVHDFLMHNYASDKEAVWSRKSLKCLNLLISKARINLKNSDKTFLVKIEEKNKLKSKSSRTFLDKNTHRTYV